MAEKKPKKEKGLIVKEPKPAVQRPVALSPEALISQGIEKGLSVEVMEKLLAMRTQLKQEAAKEAFIQAMAEFQSECPTIQKTKGVLEKNSTTKYRYKYAPLESIVEQVRELISKNGFSYAFDEEKDEKNTKIICMVTHRDGHTEKTTFQLPIGSESFMSDVQKHGARMTFGKRYAFCNAFGILTGDEDTDATEEDGRNVGKPDEGEETPAPKKPSKFDQLLKKMEMLRVDQLDDFLEKMKASTQYTVDQKNEAIAKVMELKTR